MTSNISQAFRTTIEQFVDRVEGLSGVFPSFIGMTATMHIEAEKRLREKLSEWMHDTASGDDAPDGDDGFSGDQQLASGKKALHVYARIIESYASEGTSADELLRLMEHLELSENDEDKEHEARNDEDKEHEARNDEDKEHEDRNDEDKEHEARNDEDGDWTENFPIPIEEISNFKRMQRQIRRGATCFGILPGTFIIALVAQFDVLVSGLIRCMFLAKPDIMNSVEHHITVSQLMALSDLEAAKEHVIASTIDAVMRKSHTEQIEWMEKRVGVSLRKFEAWPDFVEITQRRHLHAHTDGIVSEQYVTECTRNSVPLKGVAVRKRLTTSPAYTVRAHFTLLEVGIKLGQVVWRKLCPAHNEEANSSINNLIVELIDRQHFNLAFNLLDFVSDSEKFPPKGYTAEYRLIFTVNRALAYKLSGNAKECRAIVDAEEWGHLGTKFQLARAALQDDFDEVFKLMQVIGASSEWRHYYRDWPLFKHIRELPGFHNVYRDIYGQSYIRENSGVAGE